MKNGNRVSRTRKAQAAAPQGPTPSTTAVNGTADRTQHKRAAEAPASERAPRPARELLISELRAEQLAYVAELLQVDAGVLVERVVRNYIAFVRQYPHVAQSRPNFAHCTDCCPDLPAPLGAELYDVCDIYRLDHNSLVDSALYAYFTMLKGGETEVQLAKKHPGEIDPENIVYLLSMATPRAQRLFGRIANQLQDKPFGDACSDLDALRELIMHHPGLEAEREALDMISEGATRLWASPAAQAQWREARASR